MPVHIDDVMGVSSQHGHTDYSGSEQHGWIHVQDCPYPLGSTEAKAWWKSVVEPHTKSHITPEMKVQYGDKVVGAYQGKALVPGSAGKGQGDFKFMVDKIQVTRGLSEDAAKRIAGSTFWKKYGF